MIYEYLDSIRGAWKDGQTFLAVLLYTTGVIVAITSALVAHTLGALVIGYGPVAWVTVAVAVPLLAVGFRAIVS